MNDLGVTTEKEQKHIGGLVTDPDLWSEVEVIMIPPRLRLQLGHLLTWEWEHWHPGRCLRTRRQGFTTESDCRTNAGLWAMMSDVHDRDMHTHNTKVRSVFSWAFLITDLDGQVVEFQIGFNYAEEAKRAAREWMRDGYTGQNGETGGGDV